MVESRGILEYAGEGRVVVREHGEEGVSIDVPAAGMKGAMQAKTRAGMVVQAAFLLTCVISPGVIAFFVVKGEDWWFSWLAAFAVVGMVLLLGGIFMTMARTRTYLRVRDGGLMFITSGMGDTTRVHMAVSEVQSVRALRREDDSYWGLEIQRVRYDTPYCLMKGVHEREIRLVAKKLAAAVEAAKERGGAAGGSAG